MPVMAHTEWVGGLKWGRDSRILHRTQLKLVGQMGGAMLLVYGMEFEFGKEPSTWRYCC
jgi:hypothetical protein